MIVEEDALEFDVLVEIPKGSRNKYEVDHETAGSASTGRCSPRPSTPPTTATSRTPSASTATRSTRWCCCREPTFPGCLIECRAIGMFRMTDEAGGDDKVLCVPVSDPRLEHLRDINHVPKFDRLEIQHFFEVYKDLEPGKSVEGANWVGRAEAEKEVRASFERAKTEGHGSDLANIADDSLGERRH